MEFRLVFQDPAQGETSEQLINTLLLSGLVQIIILLWINDLD